MKTDGLPVSFLDEMKQLLGDEYEDYLKSFQMPHFSGIRINSLKITNEHWQKIAPFPTEPVPWTPNGYYYEEEIKPSKDPYYFAGLYYLQEPSAMLPAAVLPVTPGDRVLDLCAAPGGKSTELGARLQGQGVLFSNDISNSRAKALLKNLELFGIPNICVTSETPEKLAQELPEYFDKILVDAPCSGEGMFRKDETMVKDWLVHGPGYYGPIQKQILEAAAALLAPGGVMVYSTCTFSVQENEESVSWLLSRHKDLELVPVPRFSGAADGIGLTGCIRLFPHRIKGEGHFLAMIRKKGTRLRNEGHRKPDISSQEQPYALTEDSRQLLADLLQALSGSEKQLFHRDGFLYLLPKDTWIPKNLRFLRTGLLLGELKKGRLEPSQASAMALTLTGASSFSPLNLRRGDERIIRYLKGETIALQDSEIAKGWRLVCIDGFPLGWGKESGSMLKNKYYPGWRWQ